MNRLLQTKWVQPIVSAVLILLFMPISPSSSSDANGQYLSSVKASPTGQAYYSVSKYSDRIDELQRTVSVDAHNTPVRDVIEDIVSQAELGLAYNAGLISLKQPITIQLDKVSVGTALEKVLGETAFEARISQMREIVLRKRPQPELKVVQLQQDISGTVTDAQTGEPLPGVNVFVSSNPTTGTSTDSDGAYSLTVPDAADSLSFSFVGYESQTIAIDGQTTINIALSPQVQAFEDVVVTALGISRDERSVGYSTQQVDGENLSFSKEQNVIGSLSGKIAGVQITGSSGASMGGTQTIKIRGISSLNGEGQPLIVVDGTPISNGNFSSYSGQDFGNLAQDINPNDIKSINVLKGPSASALYGIRGQNGVVMITTKSGRGADNFQVDVNSSFSVQQATNFMDYQNKYGGGYTQEWQTLPNGDKYVQAHADESWGPKLDGTMVREFSSFYPQDPLYGQLTPFDPQPDNVKNFYETGYKSNQGITISGGSENSNYRLSFNDTRVTGVVPNTDLRRNNLGVSAGIDVSEVIRFSTNVNYAANDAQRPPQGYGYGATYFRQWFQRNVEMDQLKDYKYGDGTIKHWNIDDDDYLTGSMPTPNYWSNPYFLTYESPTLDSRNRFFGDVGVEIKPLQGLSISGFIRGDIYVQNIEDKTADGGVETPGYNVTKYENQEMNYELTAQYTQNWDEFSLDATVGTNMFDEDYSYLEQETVGGLTSPGYFNIDASVDRPENESYKREKRILSAYGLASLGYRETYFVDVSLRNDKSSTLPEDNNSYWYPSVSGSFVFSEVVDWEPLTFGKLRASYAKAGTDLAPYQTTQNYIVGNNYDNVNTLSLPDNLDNPNIKPSFSTSYEAGIDLRFFERVELNFTYYNQETKNQIIPLDISGTSGYGSATINAGLIENSGIEMSLSGSPVQSSNFAWTSTFNLARNQNKVVRLHPDIDVYTHGSTTYSGVTTYMNSYEGAAYGRLVGPAYQRDEETGKILLDDNNMPMWTESTYDFGSVLPDFTGGFQNVFNYRNFNLSTMIDFQIGGQFFSRSRLLAAKTGLSKETAAMNDRGMNVRDPVSEGGGVKVEGISSSTGEPVTAYVDAQDYYNGILGDDIYEPWVTDASYVKLREVRLGYSLSSRALERLPVRSVGFALYVNNPVMIWQKAPAGLDPSELSSGSQDVTWYESAQLNTVRSYGINVNLTF